MRLSDDDLPKGLSYQIGLDRTQESVISSHFMSELCRNQALELYDDEQFSAKSLTITDRALREQLLPSLRRAADMFARDRASAAKRRALNNCASYGLKDPRKLGSAEFITEVMFDRQFRRGPRETCSRAALRSRVAERIAAGAPIQMAIPALPYKLSSPLKNRGQLPDLAEANFLLGLYEIAAAVEVLYREASPRHSGPMASFTVISDGSRFNKLLNESELVLEAYRNELTQWVSRLHLNGYVEVIDYQLLLRHRLPEAARASKEVLRERAERQYSHAMTPLFDPCNIHASLAAARICDPDPEQANPEGRFVSLLKSLVFTVNYTCIERFKAMSPQRYRALYQELTGHIFQRFTTLTTTELQSYEEEAGGCHGFLRTSGAKECLRQAMLNEVWTATIAYIAEIKSDRELASEPIATCLPDHFRWTIHAKPGQLGLLTPGGSGKPVQAWAGAAVFKRAGRSGIKLSTLPVLALEGTGAIPVRCEDGSSAGERSRQPLFYLYPDVAPGGIDDLLAGLSARLVRRRAS